MQLLWMRLTLLICVDFISCYCIKLYESHCSLRGVSWFLCVQNHVIYKQVRLDFLLYDLCPLSLFLFFFFLAKWLSVKLPGLYRIAVVAVVVLVWLWILAGMPLTSAQSIEFRFWVVAVLPRLCWGMFLHYPVCLIDFFLLNHGRMLYLIKRFLSIYWNNNDYFLQLVNVRYHIYWSGYVVPSMLSGVYFTCSG